MNQALGVLVGLVLALALIRLSRRWKPARAQRAFAVGLVVTALLYVVLALVGRASARWLFIEGLGVVLYGSAAWLGFRRWPAVLALGWAAHVVWDMTLHLGGAGADFTPDWYPWLCLGFDLPIGIALMVRGEKASAA